MLPVRKAILYRPPEDHGAFHEQAAFPEARGTTRRHQAQTRGGKQLISNTARRSDGVHVRVVAEQKPDVEAEPASATLEDAYLWLVRTPSLQA